jgi:catechol 2,3-dioxygenase-like lactoylglutathione lyase family enzyme
MVRFTGVTPILHVASMEASLAYYVDILGFERQWGDESFGCVRRGDVSVMLCQGEQGRPGTWLYISVDDADALHRELLPRGAFIRTPPTNYPWGARELHVTDPDGHVLRFGSDALPGEPPGDWIDSEGVRWTPEPDGSWRKAP